MKRQIPIAIETPASTHRVPQQPDIRIHMPGGEIAQILSQHGEFEVANTGRKEIDPKRGRLWDGVHVVVDRTTRQWREDPDHHARLERDPVPAQDPVPDEGRPAAARA